LQTNAAGCDFLIDAETHRALAGSAPANPFGPLQFRGFPQTMESYAIMSQV
jgi:class 3 adenylate cyclase